MEPGDERSVVLIRWNGVDRGEAIAALEDWARQIAAIQQGVAFDLVESSFYASAPFPADALLWLPNFAAAPAPPVGLDVTALRVRKFETSSSQLHGL